MWMVQRVGEGCCKRGNARLVEEGIRGKVGYLLVESVVEDNRYKTAGRQ